MLSSSEGGEGGGSAVAPLKTYTEVFWEQFPQYLAIGMTEAQYWDRDCQLVRAYRDAEALRLERSNRELWMQGAYFYEALCRVSPILHAFARNGTKPVPYLPEPFAITDQQAERREASREKKTFDKGKAMLESFMTAHNRKFEGK